MPAGDAQPRAEYIAALRNLVPLDEYGACKRDRASPHLAVIQSLKGRHLPYSSAMQRAQRNATTRYKFYVAIENALAPGYATEKLLSNALESGAVPVYLGAPDLETVLPGGPGGTREPWLVDASAFASPAALADELRAIAADPRRWASYLSWREAARRGAPLFPGAARAVREALDPPTSDAAFLAEPASDEPVLRDFHGDDLSRRAAAVCRLCDAQYTARILEESRPRGKLLGARLAERAAAIATMRSPSWWGPRLFGERQLVLE